MFKVGTLRFCGSTEFAGGLWAGVELQQPEGKNDGSVAGVHYFTCRMKHGITVIPFLLSLHTSSWEEGYSYCITTKLYFMPVFLSLFILFFLNTRRTIKK